MMNGKDTMVSVSSVCILGMLLLGSCLSMLNGSALAPETGVETVVTAAPPPPNNGTQGGYNIDQAISDKAQLNTLAFDGLGFMTGDLYTDSFLPPGKVADFFGFQYLRDNTANGMGHNTDFVTNCANNVLYTMNATQKGWMTALAKEQTLSVNQFAMDRYPLMVAFRRNMDGDLPAGSLGLSREAVMAYSADLYELDAQISLQRAQLFSNILNSLSPSQKSVFEDMVSGGFASWPVLPDQVDKKNLSKDECVLIMTYASEMFGWYAGDVEADTYFCPERQADYFGGFFIKDAPAIGNPGYTINESMTGDKGEAFLNALDATQRAIVTGLVDAQRSDILGIVEKRRTIATELREGWINGSIDTDKVIQLGREYGQYDGEISYLYAIAFSKVNATLTEQQRKKLFEIRDLDNYTSEPDKIYLYSEKVDRPAIRNTNFLFISGRSLPDTGQTASYTETFGEDSDYTVNTPSFKDNGDGTITDQVTGLIWQKNDGGEMTWDSAKAYAEVLILGGNDDWRLPTDDEIFNLLDHGRRNPAIDPIFNVSGAEYFWSNETAMDDPGKVWSANAGGGIGPHPMNETKSSGGAKSFHVICVRGSNSVEKEYSDNGDGTVTSNSTGLTWQQEGPSMNMTWEQAIAYCEGLSLGGLDDWRLPNIKELRSVNDVTVSKPSVDRTAFPGALATKYWSSSSEINEPSRAWYVDFDYGLVTYEAKTTSLQVRAVRGGIEEVIPPTTPPTISSTRQVPSEPTSKDIVHVTSKVTSTTSIGSVVLNYRTIEPLTRGSSEITVFSETMGTVEIKPWKGNDSDNQWTIQSSKADSIEQRKEANYGPGNPCGMEFGTGTNDLNDTSVENAVGIDARGTAGYVEFYLWSDGLEGTDGWTFQFDGGSGFVTRLSELNGDNHSWKRYHYDLQSSELVGNLKMRFQFRAGDQGDRIRIDLITVNVTSSGSGSGWVQVPMKDDGAHGDGPSGDGTFGAEVPAFPNGTTVKYYITAIDTDGLKGSDPSNAPLATYSYMIPGGDGGRDDGTDDGNDDNSTDDSDDQDDDGNQTDDGNDHGGNQTKDSDGDGMPDEWEKKYGLNPHNSTDAAQDLDKDGLSNLEESIAGTDPNIKDTDGDGYSDKDEIDHGTDPLDARDIPDQVTTRHVQWEFIVLAAVILFSAILISLALFLRRGSSVEGAKEE